MEMEAADKTGNNGKEAEPEAGPSADGAPTTPRPKMADRAIGVFVHESELLKMDFLVSHPVVKVRQVSFISTPLQFSFSWSQLMRLVIGKITKVGISAVIWYWPLYVHLLFLF
jgi:hypothetical protein